MRAKKNFETSRLLIDTALKKLKDCEVDDNWSSAVLSVLEMLYDDFQAVNLEVIDLKVYDLLVYLAEKLPHSTKKRQIFQKINK